MKNNLEKIKFALVGGTNTAIAFAILFLLTSVGLPVVISNFISTSIALTFSFFANKKFTFKSQKTDKKHFLYFMSITLFGLWAIQPIIISLFSLFASNLIANSSIILFIGKLLATIATLVWNYSLYKIFVFKD